MEQASKPKLTEKLTIPLSLSLSLSLSFFHDTFSNKNGVHVLYREVEVRYKRKTKIFPRTVDDFKSSLEEIEPPRNASGASYLTFEGHKETIFSLSYLFSFCLNLHHDGSRPFSSISSLCLFVLNRFSSL